MEAAWLCAWLQIGGDLHSYPFWIKYTFITKYPICPHIAEVLPTPCVEKLRSLLHYIPPPLSPTLFLSLTLFPLSFLRADALPTVNHAQYMWKRMLMFQDRPRICLDVVARGVYMLSRHAMYITNLDHTKSALNILYVYCLRYCRTPFHAYRWW